MSFFDFMGGSGQSWDELIGTMFVQANNSLTGAYASSNIDESWWAAVVGSPSTPGMLSTWLPVIAGFSVVLSTAQIVSSIFRGSGIGVIRGGVGAILSIPLTYVTVMLVMMLSSVVDAMSAYILKVGATDNANAFMKIFGVQIINGEFTGVNSKYQMWEGVGNATGSMSMLVPALLAGIILLLSWFLSGVMALRSLGVVIMASMAGWAVTALTSDFTKAWFPSWLKITVGLLLAKPFSAAVLVMSATVFNHSDSGAQFFAGLAGLVISIAMPFLVIKFVSFTAAGAVSEQDSAFSGAGGLLGRSTSRVSQSMSRIRRR
ncbi:hypothetical protein ACN08Y_10690 [Rothia sp. P5764]|uniref:hypothetical protein n=1 Tax=Rothia sp. P5764 TaxID=3402654 RepID=UPI003AD6C743